MILDWLIKKAAKSNSSSQALPQQQQQQHHSDQQVRIHQDSQQQQQQQQQKQQFLQYEKEFNQFREQINIKLDTKLDAIERTLKRLVDKLETIQQSEQQQPPFGSVVSSFFHDVKEGAIHYWHALTGNRTFVGTASFAQSLSSLQSQVANRLRMAWEHSILVAHDLQTRATTEAHTRYEQAIKFAVANGVPKEYTPMAVISVSILVGLIVTVLTFILFRAAVWPVICRLFRGVGWLLSFPFLLIRKICCCGKCGRRESRGALPEFGLGGQSGSGSGSSGASKRRKKKKKTASASAGAGASAAAQGSAEPDVPDSDGDD